MNTAALAFAFLLGLAFYAVAFGWLVPLVGWPAALAVVLGGVGAAIVLAVRGEAS